MKEWRLPKSPRPPEVYDASGNTLIKQADIRHDGYYNVELAPGIYVVNINHLGIDRSSDVPREIEIRAGNTVELNIDIDTGIR